MTTLRLTYEELAEHTGRTPEGARMLARRRLWPIQRGNDGKARVVVDEADLVGRPLGRPPGRSPEHATGDRLLNHLFDQVDGELVAELRDRIKAFEAERAALLEAGDNLVDQLGKACERAAKAEGRADTLERALEDLAGRLDRATEELRDLRRPWWRKLLG